MGTLYVVGTPIGNLEDLSPRAQRILSSVAVVACEDTRVTKKLLSHFSITTLCVSLHQHSSDRVIAELLDRAQQGSDVAYVTDAGTPGIADPGGQLVAAAHRRSISVVSVPGPTAVAAALSISGLPADSFLFLGFLPHKKGRQTALKRIAETEESVVLYESPHRAEKLLRELVEHVPDRMIAIGREITKLHESLVRGRPNELIEYFESHPDELRGEFVFVIAPQP